MDEFHEKIHLVFNPKRKPLSVVEIKTSLEGERKYYLGSIHANNLLTVFY